MTNKGWFEKGHISWIKNKTHSEEVRKKLSISHKGQHSSPETEFKKGLKPWNTGKSGYAGRNKGYRHTELSKIKMSEVKKGKHFSLQSEFKKGCVPWNKGLKGIQVALRKGGLPKCINCGKILSAYSCKRCENCWNKNHPKGKNHPMYGIHRFGENAPAWQGGKSFEPYSHLFNQQLKDRIRVRDNFICQLCNIPELECSHCLAIHHIDYDKNNCK